MDQRLRTDQQNAEAPSPRHQCDECDVAWRGTDPTCWMCGRDTAAAPPALRVVETTRDAASIVRPRQPTGPLLTRWGTTVTQAMAMGLPDPRAPRAV